MLLFQAVLNDAAILSIAYDTSAAGISLQPGTCVHLARLGWPVSQRHQGPRDDAVSFPGRFDQQPQRPGDCGTILR